MRVAALLSAATMGCSDSAADGDDGAGTAGNGGGTPVDFVPTAEDFDCLKNWTPVRRFFLTNKMGFLDEAVEVANSPTGGTYPVGTIIQLIPQEAMVKRGEGFSPETNNWEFFRLIPEDQGTVIEVRGGAEVMGAIGGSCAGCHSGADPQWDFVCEETHGCVEIGLSTEFIRDLQNSDPRCQ